MNLGVVAIAAVWLMLVFGLLVRRLGRLAKVMQFVAIGVEQLGKALQIDAGNQLRKEKLDRQHMATVTELVGAQQRVVEQNNMGLAAVDAWRAEEREHMKSVRSGITDTCEDVMGIRRVTIDGEKAHILAQRVLKVLNGAHRPTAEVALLIAYCCVAEGVQHLPEAGRRQRAGWIVSRGAEELCKLIEEASRMPVGSFVAAPPSTSH